MKGTTVGAQPPGRKAPRRRCDCRGAHIGGTSTSQLIRRSQYHAQLPYPYPYHYLDASYLLGRVARILEVVAIFVRTNRGHTKPRCIRQEKN